MAENMYSATLRIPGEFFAHKYPPSDSNIFFEEFRTEFWIAKPEASACTSYK